MNISSNVSSINAHSNWGNANGNNIANVNSKDYSTLETSIEQSDSANVKAQITQIDRPVELSTEITEQIPVLYGIKGNITAIKTQNELYESILDIKA